MKPKDISKQPRYLRAAVAHGADTVDRAGGTFDAGVIRGVSVITRGEALGHDLWIDQDFLSDVTAAINGSEAASGGIKARFTHPGLSSDGIASKLGRITDAKTIGDRVVADLNFAEFATKTPDGDLADYVMSLAEEDPESFGLSIVFEHDYDAQEEHTSDNTFGRDRFVSPDENNKDNYPHARMAKLRSADVVDEPAANPNGLFHREQEIAQEADSLIEYALGLSGEKPECGCLSVDADRVSAAVTRFLSRHDLTLVTKGDDMPKDETPVETPAEEPQLSAADVREEFAAELARFTEAFGATSAAEWVAEGLSFSDAQSRHIGGLNAKIDALQAKVGELQETLNSIDTGESEPAEYGEGNDSPQPKRGGLSSKIKISGRSYEEN